MKHNKIIEILQRVISPDIHISLYTYPDPLARLLIWGIQGRTEADDRLREFTRNLGTVLCGKDIKCNFPTRTSSICLLSCLLSLKLNQTNGKDT